jgi:hypothetical protein
MTENFKIRKLGVDVLLKVLNITNDSPFPEIKE